MLKPIKNFARNARYRLAFRRAIAVTREHGYTVPLLRKEVPTPNHGKLRDEFYAYLSSSDLDPKRSAGQCLKWTHALLPWMNELVAQEVQITIGALIRRRDRKILFPCESKNLFTLAATGAVPAGMAIKFHAWWTLQDATIVDPTLMYSFARANPTHQLKFYERGIICGRAADIAEFDYAPIGVGADLVEQIDRATGIGLLAKGTSTAELHHMSKVMIPLGGN